MINKLIARDVYLRAANSHFRVWQSPKRMATEELAAAAAASDEKTARLKALRLEKEKLDAEFVIPSSRTGNVKKRASTSINID